MKTLKNGLKQRNVDSNHIRVILTDYSHKDCVKVALYCAEDCFHINPIKESQICIGLIKKWLEDEKSVTVEELRTASDAAAAYAYSASNAVADAAAYSAANAAYAAVNAANAAYWAVRSFNDEESKREEYRFYARLFAYEDLTYPYKDFAKTFNLDNPTDLNIFLDFLTDNYPTAITYDREEYFKTKLAKEYLKVIYQ